MFKQRELSIILILAGLITLLTLFLSRADCPGCPDALYYQGWPLAFLQTGGFAGISRWIPLNLLFDLLFWVVVLAAGWWVIKKFKRTT